MGVFGSCHGDDQMAKTKKIKCVSYVHVGDKLVCTDDLTRSQKEYVGTSLQMAMLSAAFNGQVRFSVDLPPRDQVFSSRESGDDSETCSA